MRFIRKSLLGALLWQALVTQAAIGPRIGAGSTHSFFIETNGSLWAMGANYTGQLGDGTLSQKYSPEQIISNGIVAVSCGYDFTLFLDSASNLWVTGDNDWGQLGIGGAGSATTPVLVTNNVVAISAGYDHSLFRTSDGALWGMGHNIDGELGIGVGIDSLAPTEIVSNGVIAVAAGQGFSLFVKSDNSLWAIGNNSSGQLGDGTSGTIVYTPEEIVSSGVVAVAAGYSHSMFLKSDGSLWVMGDNALGELGNGTASPAVSPDEIVSNGVVAIAAGQYFSLFIKSDGSLWAMGVNSYGQLGTGPTFGNGSFVFTNVPEEVVSNGVVAVSAGGFHSLFLKSDGSVWGMGDNFNGQLGDGFTVGELSSFSAVPEQIFPALAPVLTAGVSLGTNVQVQATCLFGGSYSLLTVTNPKQPISEWTETATNVVNCRGTNNFTATFTNAVNRLPMQFYILRSH